MRLPPRPAAGILALLLVGFSWAHGAQDRQAPEWAVSRWLNEDPGGLADNRNRVILMEFFQLWCSGCNRFSIPLFDRWNRSYGDREDVRVVSIHSVFEGHSYQTEERLERFIEEKGIRHAVGIDAYADEADETPITMRRFGTRGTPHVVIVDKRGQIRFSHFGSFDPGPVEMLIESLLEEEGPAATAAAAGIDPRLSGMYTVRFEQTSKSCGVLLPPLVMKAKVDVSRDRVVASFSRSFLGTNSIEAEHDRERARFEAHMERRVEVAVAHADVVLDLAGWIDENEGEPEIDFQVWFTKIADEPEWDCKVEGRGHARKDSGP